MSATDFDPYTRPRVGHLQDDLKAAGADRPSGGAAGGGFEFADLLDVVNPLHHIPIVGNVYRALTGDQIGGAARIAGGALFGGPFGAVSAAFNQIFEDATGRDMAETALAVVTGEDLGPAPDEAAADAAVQAQPASAGAQEGAQAIVQAGVHADVPAGALEGGELVYWNPVPPDAAARLAAAGIAPPAATSQAGGVAPPADVARTAAPAAAARMAQPAPQVDSRAAARVAAEAAPAAPPAAGGPGAGPAAGDGVLTGDAALAAFAADLRRAAAPAPGAAPTPAPGPAPGPAPQQAAAALRGGGRPDGFMPVSPRDFAGPRPQTGPTRALAVETVLPPQPNAPAEARGPLAPTPKTPPTAPLPTGSGPTGSGPAGSVSSGTFAAPPASDADFAARMMHALQKYDAMNRSGS